MAVDLRPNYINLSGVRNNNNLQKTTTSGSDRGQDFDCWCLKHFVLKKKKNGFKYSSRESMSRSFLVESSMNEAVRRCDQKRFLAVTRHSQDGIQDVMLQNCKNDIVHSWHLKV